MKRMLTTAAALAGLVLAAAAGVRAQETAAAGAAAQQTAVPVRRTVRGRTLVSESLPPIRIKFDKGFDYAGTQSFVLYGGAQVEQYFFVDADDGRFRRAYLVQFEGYLPTNTHTYDYQIKDTVKLGGLDFMHDTRAVNVPAFRKQYPDSDAGRAAAFLEGKGYQLEGEDIVFQRFVRLVDEARRNELLVIYYESLGGAGLTAADLAEGGRAAADRERIFRGVRERALKYFKVSK